MMLSPGEGMPSLRRPSQSYVDNYIARRGGSELTPGRAASSGCGSASSVPPPAVASSSLTSPPSLPTPGRHTPRIFYALERDCPAQYMPEMNVVSPRALRAVRTLLLCLCTTQLSLSFGILYLISVTHFLHDSTSELFTEAVAALCGFAACAGFVGVWTSSRSMLLFFYINQLWSLSNVSTFAVINLMSADQNGAACQLYRAGELSAQRLRDSGLDCDALRSTSQFLLGGLALMLAQLWASCFFAKTYSEMLQDQENDEQDRALIKFVWHRRGETWSKLERFEDLVLRQFEELRMSLVAHAHGAARTHDQQHRSPAVPRNAAARGLCGGAIPVPAACSAPLGAGLGLTGAFDASSHVGPRAAMHPAGSALSARALEAGLPPTVALAPPKVPPPLPSTPRSPAPHVGPR